MNRWIFQGNQDTFDVTQYVSTTPYLYWSVKHKSHQEKISLGDPVFIWRARGRSREMPGIIAFGKIIEACTPKQHVKFPDYLSEFLWSDIDQEISEVKAGVEIQEVRLTPSDGMLSFYNIRTVPELSGMQIVTARTGTNFLLTSPQFNRLFELWGPKNNLIDLELFDNKNYYSNEGKIRYRFHRIRERDPKLVSIAKIQFLDKHGKLFCELCKFDFKEIYGELGEGFIEAHHIKPLERMEDGEKTSVSDLMMVCSNCHRILHRGDPFKNLDSIKNNLNNKRIGLVDY